MKKILIPLYGTDFPETAMRFISSLNKRSSLFLTSLVLPRTPRIENWAAYSAVSAGNLKDISAEENAATFRTKCKTSHIAYSMHMGTTEPGIPQIIKETKFSDLLVVSDNTLYGEDASTSLEVLHKIMHNAECPILVIPEGMKTPEQIMIAYDGSESCMFAAKQFVYLFPELRTVEVTVVYIDREGITNMPDKEQIELWIKGHFDHYSLVTVNTDAAKYFSDQTNTHPILVVTGSFGRTAVSEWLHSSFAAKLVSEYHIPLFSSHGG